MERIISKARQHLKQGKENHCSSENGYGAKYLADALTLFQLVESQYQNEMQDSERWNKFGLELADLQFYIGQSEYCQGNWEVSLKALQESLSIQEEVMGRYDVKTAELYLWISDVYYEWGRKYYQQSLIAARTGLRIQRYLFGRRMALENEHHGEHFIKHVLLETGYNSNDITSHHEAMMVSIKHEKNGDDLRLAGEIDKALLKYKKAAEIESFEFGTINPDWAYLWRKSACSSTVSQLNISNDIDFLTIDTFSQDWLNDPEACWPSKACQAIIRGDDHLEIHDYQLAVAEFRKAIQLVTAEQQQQQIHLEQSPSNTFGKQQKIIDDSCPNLEIGNKSFLILHIVVCIITIMTFMGMRKKQSFSNQHQKSEQKSLNSLSVTKEAARDLLLDDTSNSTDHSIGAGDETSKFAEDSAPQTCNDTSMEKQYFDTTSSLEKEQRVKENSDRNPCKLELDKAYKGIKACPKIVQLEPNLIDCSHTEIHETTLKGIEHGDRDSDSQDELSDYDIVRKDGQKETAKKI